MPTLAEEKKIRARIQRYERNLKKRNYRDGSGLRFLVGPLYLVLDDTEGALAHYKWFARKFPDDGGEPFHRLGWVLAMLRAQKPVQAAERLKLAHMANTYIIPAILDIPHGQPEVRRWSNWQDEEYIRQAPQEFLAMWRLEEKAWLKSVWEKPDFRDFVQTHMELMCKLDREPRGPGRKALVEVLSALCENGKSKGAAKASKSETVH